MTKALVLTGKTFGRFTVLRRAANNPSGGSMWEVRCICGTLRVVGGPRLVSGHSKSCGCLSAEVTRARSTTHGQGARVKRSRAYVAWKEMKRRCYNPKSKSYATYGARGIDVYPIWRDSFQCFYGDMGDCPEGYELDRLDNSKGYYPGNVRWASEVTQARNRRYCKLSVDKAKALRNDTRKIGVLAAEYGVSPSTVKRVKAGKSWCNPDATAPVGKTIHINEV